LDAITGATKMTQYSFPNDITKALRKQAEECERAEQSPMTGVSTWPKESTLEWQAADLLDERLEEIRHYENLRDKFVELWLDMSELLGLDK
jgi:hypothetical protein